MASQSGTHPLVQTSVLADWSSLKVWKWPTDQTQDRAQLPSSRRVGSPQIELSVTLAGDIGEELNKEGLVTPGSPPPLDSCGLHNCFTTWKQVTLNWIIADVSAVIFWPVWDLGRKFTWIQSVGCRAAEDFSELDSDAKSCSGLDSGNQLRSFDSSRSYYEYVTLETFM